VQLQELAKATTDADARRWTDRLLSDLGANVAVTLKELRSAIMKEVSPSTCRSLCVELCVHVRACVCVFVCVPACVRACVLCACMCVCVRGRKIVRQ
jgi:hypothetical protein